MGFLLRLVASGDAMASETRAAQRLGGEGALGGGLLDPWDGFLIGPENELAQSAARAVARGDHAGLSPLVLTGPAGSGKTRVVEALAAEAELRRPGLAIEAISAETFAAACAVAVAKRGGWQELRERFRDLDLLILDDLETLSRAPLALGELAFTLDVLEMQGAAVVVTSRETPWQGRLGHERLASRLRGGLVVRLEPPGVGLRRRYLLDQARTRGIVLGASALDELLEVGSDFRAMDGALARLALAARVDRRPIDQTLVRAMAAEGGVRPDPPTIEAIARAVAARFAVPLKELRSASRRAAVVEPRHLAIWLARQSTGASFARLGAFFGGRDTATIRHACRAAAARLEADPGLSAVVAALGLGVPARGGDGATSAERAQTSRGKARTDSPGAGAAKTPHRRTRSPRVQG